MPKNLIMNYEEVQHKFTPLMKRIVNKFPSFYREDLEQEAKAALFQALKNWDSSRSMFSTFAYLNMNSACTKYMRDKAFSVRIPPRKYEAGLRADCISLDADTCDGATLESLFGCASDEDAIDNSLFLWGNLKLLADRGIITWKDFSILYFKYFQHWDTEELSRNFGISKSSVPRKIGNLLQKIRPYFLGRKII